MKDKITLRNERKSRKPNFLRTSSVGKKQFTNWRKPRGLHNKLRLHKAGHINLPSIGYGSPKDVRGLSRNGLILFQISNIYDVNSIDKEKHIAIIDKSVGMKKRIEILKKLKELGVKVYNYKNVDEFLSSKQKIIEDKKKKKLEKLETKKKKKKELEDKAKEKESKKEEDKGKKTKEFEEKIKEDMKKTSPEIK